VRLLELREHLKLRRANRSYTATSLNRFINEAYLDLASRRAWGWLRRMRRYSTAAPLTVNVTGNTGSRKLVPAGGTVPTAWGKRLLLDGRIYRITNVSADGTTWTVDHPLHAAAAVSPWVVSVQVLYDQVSLPRSTDIVVGVKRIQGGSASSMTGVEPWMFQDRARSSLGMPTHYSTIRKEPIPPPEFAPPGPVASGGTTGGPGAGTFTYWMTFIDKQSGAESALSPPLEVTYTTGEKQVFTVALTNSSRNDFLFRLYRSKKHETGEDPKPYFLHESQAVEEVVTDETGDQYLGEQSVDSASSVFLSLYPAPNASYDMEVMYQHQVVELGEDNHRPLFDEVDHPVLIDGAEALMLQASDEFKAAQVARGLFDQGVYRMMQRDKLSQNTLTPIASRMGASRIRAPFTAERWEYP
tara:strand:+ start:13706 stop:14944 length:1239 start_codon:yes stop_codon:yes gene_type:complete